MIIGIAGKKGSGKSFAARCLCEELCTYPWEWDTNSFAQHMKVIVAGIIDPRCPSYVEDEDKNEMLPSGITRRKAYQLAADFFRAVNPDFTLQSASIEDCEKSIFDDVRYPNEIDWIHSKGGKVFYLTGRGDYNDTHESENAIGPDDCDHVIDNSGSIEDTVKKIQELL